MCFGGVALKGGGQLFLCWTLSKFGTLLLGFYNLTTPALMEKKTHISLF